MILCDFNIMESISGKLEDFIEWTMKDGNIWKVLFGLGIFFIVVAIIKGIISIIHLINPTEEDLELRREKQRKKMELKEKELELKQKELVLKQKRDKRDARHMAVEDTVSAWHLYKDVKKYRKEKKQERSNNLLKIINDQKNK